MDGLVAMTTLNNCIIFQFFALVKQMWACQNMYTLCIFLFTETSLFALNLHNFFVKCLTSR